MRGVRQRLLARSAADGLLFVAELGPPAAASDSSDAGKDSSAGAAAAAAAAEGEEEGAQNEAAGAADRGEAAAGAGEAAAGSDQEAGSGARRPKTPKMDHLVCFLPGTLALGHLHGVNTGQNSCCHLQLIFTCSICKTPRTTWRASRRGRWNVGSCTSATALPSALLPLMVRSMPMSSGGDAEMDDLEVAEDLMATCNEMYARMPAGLAPEVYIQNSTGISRISTSSSCAKCVIALQLAARTCSCCSRAHH